MFAKELTLVPYFSLAITHSHTSKEENFRSLGAELRGKNRG